MLEFALIQQCANQMPLNLAQAIVKTESRFNPYAIGVNKAKALKKQPKSYTEAISIATHLIQRGYNIDMGLAQINSSNLHWLGLSVEQVFDPCVNLNTMQKIYHMCFKKGGSEEKALSCYNTGSLSKGFRNGYVSKVMNNKTLIASSNPRSSTVHIAYPMKKINHGGISQAIVSKKTDVDTAKSSEDISAQAQRVYHSWDIFQDF